MDISPNIRQLVVAGSTHLAALSAGGAVAFPSVLLIQLTSNSTSIHLDVNTASWIGSIHGLTGVPSIFIPSLMQWRGRRLAFMIACVFHIVGWVIACTATNLTAVLISESIHGFSTNSIHAVSLLSMSEMIAPRYRNVSLVLFLVLHAFGVASVGILGRYLHWKTVSAIMLVPVLLALLVGFSWPESPAWLAYKGKFEKCERAFAWLRGSSDNSKKELEELMTAQREHLVEIEEDNHPFKSFWKTLISRDFYIPGLHICVLLNLTYWSGSLVVVIYSSEIILRLTHNEQVASFGGVIINSILFVCVCVSAVLVRRYNNKPVLLYSTLCASLCLLCLSATNYAQNIKIIGNSMAGLYLLVVYMVSISLGVLPVVFSITSELMPVRHRGIGGVLYVILICVFHSSSLKFVPYLFQYINLWGTLLLFGVNAIICGLFVWKYVPETKGKTLQQLEDYYVYGSSCEKRHVNEDTEQ